MCIRDSLQSLLSMNDGYLKYRQSLEDEINNMRKERYAMEQKLQKMLQLMEIPQSSNNINPEGGQTMSSMADKLLIRLSFLKEENNVLHQLLHAPRITQKKGQDYENERGSIKKEQRPLRNQSNVNYDGRGDVAGIPALSQENRQGSLCWSNITFERDITRDSIY
eukprot:TRINITY_DN10794_c0_g1_i1.p1 TRINITY_DN10794_c0_g1~~TRINITY_DN10794_c0_g1_i1.p1  ORF type:complete len:185 (-),score=43.84 TRINITY_DN10794_c0_g1_i1:3-497(-)